MDSIFLTVVSIISRFVTVAFAIFFSYSLPDHDPGDVSRIHAGHNWNFMTAFSKWDSAHFIKISVHGYQDCEQCFAFYPLYPFLIKTLSTSLESLLPSGWLPSDIDLRIFSGVIISNASYVLSSIVLFHLLSKLNYSPKIVKLACLCHAFNPASIFFSTVYTEWCPWVVSSLHSLK